jgi:hypothetical protein
VPWVHEIYDSAEPMRRELERRKQAEAARRAESEAGLALAIPHAERGSVAAMRKVMEPLAVRHGFTIETRTTMPAGAAAFAQCDRRNIVIPPIVDAETFAIALHEAGHVLAERCTRRAPHQPDPTVTRWHHCLACETNAWTVAMRLVPFTKEMHDRLRSALKTYRRSTPGPASEKQRLDRIAGTVFYAEEKQKRLKWQMLLDRQAAVKGRNR